MTNTVTKLVKSQCTLFLYCQINSYTIKYMLLHITYNYIFIEKDHRTYVYSHGKLLANDLYSNTLPMITTFTLSLQMCVHLCGKVHGCLYVNYYHLKIVDGHTNAYFTKGNCHYAAPYDGMTTKQKIIVYFPAPTIFRLLLHPYNLFK